MESAQCTVAHLGRAQALEAWLKSTNTTLTQVNGQRKYGGPPEAWAGPAPGPRCEVFISQIPRDAYEDLLLPLFGSVGPLWEFRLMMNFSGENRGFAYAKYGSPAAAAEAVRRLHGHALRPGRRLAVRRSVEKRHLRVGHLPARVSREELWRLLRAVAPGVVGVSLSAGPGTEGASAAVAFSSHYAASMAKKTLVEEFRRRLAVTVSVQWQPPEEPLPLQKPSLLSPWEPPSPASAPPGFCKAVGGPAGPPRVHAALASAGSPETPPSRGQRLCDMRYSHTGPDGSVCWTDRLGAAGLVPVLPGPSVATTLKKARLAAALQVLQRLASLPTDGLIRDQ